MKEMTLMKLRKVSILETAKDQIVHLSGVYGGPEGPVLLCACAFLSFFFFFRRRDSLISTYNTRPQLETQEKRFRTRVALGLSQAPEIASIDVRIRF